MLTRGGGGARLAQRWPRSQSRGARRDGRARQIRSLTKPVTEVAAVCATWVTWSASSAATRLTRSTGPVVRDDERRDEADDEPADRFAEADFRPEPEVLERVLPDRELPEVDDSPRPPEERRDPDRLDPDRLDVDRLDVDRLDAEPERDDVPRLRAVLPFREAVLPRLLLRDDR